MNQQNMDKIVNIELISTSNDLLLNAQWPKLTINEQRLVLYMLAMVRKDDEDFKTYQISVRELANILGIESKNIYERFDDATNGLMSKIIRWSDPEYNDRLQKVTWCSSAMLAKGDGFVELSFDPKLKPFLLHLKGNFTQYEFRAVFKLKNHYSLRLYQLIKYHQGRARLTHQKTAMVELDWFKEFLDINPSLYNHWGHFKNKILDPSLKDLKDESDLIVTFKSLKTGRRITHLEFSWEHNLKYDQKELSLDEPIPAETPKNPLPPPVSDSNALFNELCKRLIDIGFYNIETVRKKHSVEVLKQALEDLDFEIKRRKKINQEFTLAQQGGWLQTRLKEVKGGLYQPSPFYQKHMDGEQKRQERQAEQARLNAEREQLEQAKLKRQEAISNLVTAKIEALSPVEYREIEAEARQEAESQTTQPKASRQELEEVVNGKFAELPESEQGEIEEQAQNHKDVLEVLEDGKFKIDHPIIRSIIKNRKIDIIEKRYSNSLEIPSLKRYKAGIEQRTKDNIRRIVRKRYDFESEIKMDETGEPVEA